ncbi:unnamed protein product [Paramecium pentaurelia]|uniref:RRM domain-containing protein n=1 Tax=Paramecium pentaurelia TaxID=43138 RepID=A0A8S1W425_9CILI|nr:unnamed protein product [Paramecium pentaurelia]
MSKSSKSSRSSPSKSQHQSPSPKSKSNSHPNQEKLCLHVSNLSKRVTDAELKEIFEKYGQIEYATVCMEPRSKGPGKVSRGFGFVKFAKKESVQIALEAMQDKELHGSKMKVEVSKRAEPRRKTPGRYAGYAYRRSRSRSHRRRRSISSDSYSSSRRRHHSRRRHYKRRSISKSASRSPSQSHRRRRR